jgi:SAM-dependent methyltransferase
MNTQRFEKRLWASALGSAMMWRLLRPVVRIGGPLDVDADVLHIGCGTGRFTETLAQTHPQWRITALDSDPNMIRSAYHRLHKYASRIRIVCAEPPALPYPDASFDLVIAAHVWHRLPTWRAVTLEAARVLRPQGILGLALPPGQTAAQSGWTGRHFGEGCRHRGGPHPGRHRVDTGDRLPDPRLPLPSTSDRCLILSHRSAWLDVHGDRPAQRLLGNELRPAARARRW